MKPELKTEKITLHDGREILLETGLLAKQSHGSCVVRMGDTMLLATVVSSYEAKEGIDFLPLTVDYREKFAAAGRFPGGFLKREGRPSDQEILGMRLVDRVLRPLFPKDYHSETQIMIQLMSHDENVCPDSLIGLAASTALSLSDIPFDGPISEARVGRVNGEFIINPSKSTMEESDIDLMVGASKDSIVMVEGEMKEISEKEMLEAIKFAHEAIKVQCLAQENLSKKVGNIETRDYEKTVINEELFGKINKLSYDKIYQLASEKTEKKERSERLKKIKEEVLNSFSDEEIEEKENEISSYFHKIEKKAIRNFILDNQQRLDGRKTDEIRPIWCEVSYLPKTHGSAIFTRGETQSLTTVTLGTSMDENKLDTVTLTGAERFYLHYNFPPFSTGEARMKFSVSRREVGHGNLALRALKPMIPGKPENPYTVRLVSEILESNGSSSMATVCAGTLALMDGGVKMKRPVSGIAMGLITDNAGKYAVLSDILGDEDHLGDMDFKVTGTEKGITACQMDIKIDGLDYNMLEEALNQAKDGRMHILGEMMKTLTEPREDFKSHVPRIETVEVPEDTIGGIIGKGGETIQKMQEETSTTISIGDPEDGMAIVEVFADNKDGMDEALKRINLIAYPPVAEVGETYSGKVKNIVTFGAFLEILPGIDALLHISEIDHKRVEKVEDYLKQGDVFDVKVIGKDPKNGKLKISRKALIEKPAPKPAEN